MCCYPGCDEDHRDELDDEVIYADEVADEGPAGTCDLLEHGLTGACEVCMPVMEEDEDPTAGFAYVIERDDSWH